MSPLVWGQLWAGTFGYNWKVGLVATLDCWDIQIFFRESSRARLPISYPPHSSTSFVLVYLRGDCKASPPRCPIAPRRHLERAVAFGTSLICVRAAQKRIDQLDCISAALGSQMASFDSCLMQPRSPKAWQSAAKFGPACIPVVFPARYAWQLSFSGVANAGSEGALSRVHAEGSSKLRGLVWGQTE